MKINNVELEFDPYDLEQIDKIEKFAEETDKTIIPDNASWSDIIKIRCQEIFDLFDNIFGEGTAHKVFGDKVNLRVCQEALADFLDQSRQGIDEVTASINKRFSKYAPNRAQRRAKNN